MARLAGKKKISLSEMSQTISLKNRIKRKPTRSELREFAEEAIELISARTLSNNKVGGGAFQNYSEEYAAKKGVSPSSVDLFLEGDMLDSLTYEIDERKGNVTIKVDESKTLELKKSFNHHTGDTLPKRPWFGLTSKEVAEIGSSFQTEIEDTSQAQGVAQALTARRVTVSEIERAVRDLDFDFESD